METRRLAARSNDEEGGIREAHCEAHSQPVEEIARKERNSSTEKCAKEQMESEV